MAPQLNNRNLNVQRSHNSPRVPANTPRAVPIQAPRRIVGHRDENSPSSIPSGRQLAAAKSLPRSSPAPVSRLPLPTRTPGRSAPEYSSGPSIVTIRRGTEMARSTDNELSARPVDQPAMAMLIQEDANLTSHWSADTPETPASLGETFEDYNATSESWSLVVFNPTVDHGRPRSISMTDRTSKLTTSTLDTVDLHNDTTEVTQYSSESGSRSIHDSQSRAHSPPPGSFSQLRLNSRRSSLPGTQAIQPRSRHHATASRVPIIDPGETPNLIDIRPSRTPVPSTSGTDGETPTFGRRRFDNTAELAALAALDRDPTARRHPSNSTLKKEREIGLAKKVSMANMKNQVRRLTPSPSVTDSLRRASHQVIPHQRVLQRDPQSQHELDTTLALLEGTSPLVQPSHDDFNDFAASYSRRFRHRIESAEQGARSPSSYGTTQQSEMPLHRKQVGRYPSYNSPTRASEGRRASKLQVSDHGKQEFISRDPDEITPVPLQHSRSAAGLRIAPSPIQHHEDDNTLALPQHGLRIAPSLIQHHEDDNTLTVPQHSESVAVFQSSKSKEDNTLAVTQQSESKEDKPKQRPRSDSKSRLFSNIKGLFTSKKDTAIPPVPSLDGKRLNKQPRKVHQDAFPPFEHGKSMFTVTEPSEVDNATKKYNSAAEQERKTVEVAAFVAATEALEVEASKEGDIVKREQLFALAQVMTDAMTNNREAERSMLIAEDAALSAKTSYEKTQKSVIEMGRLITTSKGSMAGVLRKIAVRAGHR